MSSTPVNPFATLKRALQKTLKRAQQGERSAYGDLRKVWTMQTTLHDRIDLVDAAVTSWLDAAKTVDQIERSLIEIQTLEEKAGLGSNGDRS